MKKLFRKDTSPVHLLENFRIIQEEVDGQAVMRCKWRFVEFTIDGAKTDFKVAHGLGFQPKDVIQTRKTGAGQITWEYDKFDKENLYVTTTGAVSARAFVGTYSEDPEQ